MNIDFYLLWKRINLHLADNTCRLCKLHIILAIRQNAVGESILVIVYIAASVTEVINKGT